jgi:hypothetical protein
MVLEPSVLASLLIGADTSHAFPLCGSSTFRLGCPLYDFGPGIGSA